MHRQIGWLLAIEGVIDIAGHPLLRSGATLASVVASDFSFSASAFLFLRNHCDLDRLGHYWRVVRYMVGVAEEQ